MPAATRMGRLMGRTIREEGRGAARALDEGRFLDLPRQVLEVGREDPDAEGQRHGWVEEERQGVVGEPER
jgi:hypothetical protein